MHWVGLDMVTRGGTPLSLHHLPETVPGRPPPHLPPAQLEEEEPPAPLK